MQEKTPFFSIVLLSYNRPTWVREAIGSVLSQSFPDWELIIIDDNSDAPVPAILRGYAELDSRIKLFFNTETTPEMRATTQRGQANINWLLKNGKVKGQVISYLADDDFYLPNRLRVFHDRFIAHPDVKAFYSDQLIIDEGGGGSLRGTLGKTKAIACSVDMGSIAHKTELFDEIGFWENYDTEEWDAVNNKAFGLKTFQVVDALFFDKIAKAGYDFHCIPVPLDVHRFNKKAYTLGIQMNETDFSGWRDI